MKRLKRLRDAVRFVRSLTWAEWLVLLAPIVVLLSALLMILGYPRG